MQSTSASFLSLITIGALIAVAGFFLMGKILAGAAVITEFLLITGSAHADSAGTAVILRRAGKGNLIFFFILFLHKTSSSFLIVGLIIKPSVDKVRFDYVYKGLGIYLGNLFYKKLGFLARDNRIDHGSIITAVAAGSVQPCGRVMRQLGNFLINLIRMSGDNKQSMFFVSLVEHLNHLGGSKLKDD